MSLGVLYQLMNEAFNEDELITICFYLEVDYENLGGVGKSGKARELVSLLKREGRLEELVERCKQMRPTYPWPDRLALAPPRPVPAAPAPVAVAESANGAGGGLFGLPFAWLKEMLAKHRERYLQHLIYRHRDFDVKGLSTQGIFNLMLQDVFVELSVAPRALHATSTDPLKVPGELREGQHGIWDFLAPDRLAHQNLAIIGPPGSGKTTLLKHMALVLTDPKERGRHHAPDRVPLLLFLRNHAQPIAEQRHYSLAEATQRALISEKMHEPPPLDWFEQHLRQGKCLVMLDGLDEVADTRQRRRTAQWVEEQMRVYGDNLFVVSSRPFGYRSNPLHGVTVLEVQPFSRGQVRHFVERWYHANEIMSAQSDDPGVRMKAQEGAEDLIRRIRNAPALSGLAVNPLLLTMIATVHRYRSSLPGRRVELYAEICEVFLGKRQAARGIEHDLTPAQKQRVLQPLAFYMMRHQQREISHREAMRVVQGPLERVSQTSQAESFLKMVENASGLLVERENGEYSFAHLTFQEYLAAAHLLESQDEESLVQHIEDSWWHETIRLYCARADATPIIRASLSQSKPAVPALTLAIECNEEAREVQPVVRQQLEAILKEGIEDPDPERRRVVAEAMLALRLKRMTRFNEELFVDGTLVTHAEYQLFLDASRAQGINHQPDHWRAESFPRGGGRAPVLGLRPTDAAAFCEWLSERDTEGWSYRLPQAGELAPFAHEGYWSGQGGRFLLEYRHLPDAPAGVLEQQLRSDQALALDEARQRALELGRALAFRLNRVLDQTVEQARHLDPAIARVLHSAQNLANSLAREVDLARKQNLVLHRALSLDRVLSLDKSIDQACKLVQERDSVHPHERASTLGPDLAKATTLVVELTLYLYLYFDLDLYRDLGRKLNLPLYQELSRDCSLARVPELSGALERARRCQSNLAPELQRALSRVLALASELHFSRVPADDARDKGRFLRWYVRYVAWLMTDFATQSAKSRGAHRSFITLFNPAHKERDVDELHQLAQAFFELYYDFALREARLLNKVPAVEGIRLVKERKV